MIINIILFLLKAFLVLSIIDFIAVVLLYICTIIKEKKAERSNKKEENK